MFSRMTGNITVAAIFIFLTAGIQAWPVTFSSPSLCSITGSTVKIPCRFKFKNRISKEWFRVQSSGGDPQVLSKDPQYSGRVSVSKREGDCELTMRNVSVSDSGVYNLRLGTDKSGWTSAPPGVHLTVTDLQVKVDVNTLGRTEVKVTCNSSCKLNTSHFYWYRNNISFKNASSIVLHSDRPSFDGNYTCQVKDSSHRSPPLCVLGTGCLGVTYTPDRVCALKGASIDLSCSYYYPADHTVTKTVWFIKKQADDEAVDVRDDEEYQGRVLYIENSQNNCSLKINNVKETDAQTYRFRFYTDEGDYTGEPGVSLSVTGLKVTVSDSASGQLMLSCITTCALSNNRNYVWYKNGQRVSECKSTSCSVAAVSGVDGYSCAVEGHDDLRSPVYSGESRTLQHVVVGLMIFLALTLILSAALCMWARKKSCANLHGGPEETEQPLDHMPCLNPDPCFCSPCFQHQSASDPDGRVAAETQDIVQYASVAFKPVHIQEVSVPPDTTDEDHVQYATVNQCKRFKKTFRMSRR